MARPDRRHPANAPGALYVDTTCIDCDTCRWMAPDVYDRVDEQSRVFVQPGDVEARRRALTALVACPTASIGIEGDALRDDLTAALDAFPLPITDSVSHCGYHAESSFGATSYFLERPEGNVMRRPDVDIAARHQHVQIAD